MPSRVGYLLASLLALGTSACSYDWGSVQPFYERDGSSVDGGGVVADPRQVVLPGFSCNPVSDVGCTSTSCFGLVASDASIASLTCRSSFGSSGQGQHCDGAENCVPGFVCWVSPGDPGTSTCEEPCFDDRDCRSSHCDTTGAYAAPYGRSTLYRCL